MESWCAQPSSHDGSVHMHFRARSVRGTQLMAADWDFAGLQNQLDEIVRNKAIYLKVATALGPFSTLDPFSAASSTSSALSSAFYYIYIHIYNNIIIVGMAFWSRVGPQKTCYALK